MIVMKKTFAICFLFAFLASCFYCAGTIDMNELMADGQVAIKKCCGAEVNEEDFKKEYKKCTETEFNLKYTFKPECLENLTKVEKIFDEECTLTKKNCREEVVDFGRKNGGHLLPCIAPK
ncbi:uncharacterized protein LOC111628844 [Centruroides sculpturatus]|uniref:uncharacterized protein LOC111628844 n=1 Tax=Centruroides sculpturatus TaxID=218467 RepID=UPI000C6CCA61|nr:uncharacterized protein LOC111628844 [Centruroides sculpturatus]